MKKLLNHFTLLLVAIFLVISFASLGCASTSSNSNTDSALKWDSKYKLGNLDNGMSYYIRKNSIPANRITLRLVVKAGSCMEEEDQKGIAHLIEHMCFNGTEHFEKSAIVDYFEKIGMNFGSDLNAYTSFEETVYKLEIPADDPEILDTAMMILHDWACAVSFTQEELDKERGVVTEEWRLGQGFQKRVNDKQIGLLLDNSVYENRLPIGDMDVIKNISRDRVLDFYKKWYRPELMSIVAVGDLDAGKLEAAIKKTMGTIPASTEKIERPVFSVPYPTEKKISILADKEIAYTQVLMFEPVKDYKIVETEEELLNQILEGMAAQIFSLRMSEITSKAESPWLTAGVSSSSLTNSTNHNYLAVFPKAGQFIPAMKQFFDECDRFINFGITESELERAKAQYLSSEELAYQNREKVESPTYADRLVYSSLVGKAQVSEEDYLKIYKRIIPSITIEDVNAAARKAFGNRGSLMFLASNPNEKLPSEKEIMEVWKNYKNAEIAAYEDESSDGLMKRPENKAKVASKKSIKDLGVKEYVLDNGIRILTKKTDFEKNYMYMNVYSKGGVYQVKEEEFPSACAALSYALYSGFEDLSYSQMIKEVSSKQIGLNFDINDTTEYFTGSCSSNYCEELLQLINLFFSQVKFNEDAWKVVIQQFNEVASNHGNSPNDVLNDKINEILYGKNDLYHVPFDLKFVSKMDAKEAEKVYKERYGNPADFTYVFVGDFEEAKLIELCQYYLGNLKTSKDREETVYKYYDFPKGKVNETVNKDKEDKGRVYISFGGELPEEKNIEKSYKESKIISYLETLLDIRLREVIREDKSGSYGISVNSYIDGYPERFYRTTISFGCEPARAEELKEEVLNQIKQLQNELVNDSYIEKLIETEKRGSENNIYDNGWWLRRINAELVFTYEPLWVSKNEKKQKVEWITAENLRDAAKKYLNTENYVSVYLMPE
ncbi:MAG: insulinase family protein [Treponema sp.]|nr:insulinase family protein [Treponema sp.]